MATTLTLRPLIVASGSEATLVVEGLAPGDAYRLALLPVREPGVRMELEAQADAQGRVAWSQRVTWQGEALCDILVGEGQVPAATLHLYAAPPEMLRRLPLRCDLHVHTTHSDGHNSPAEMVLRGRELGLDALAITDHNRYEGSQEAIEVAERLGLRLICFAGEEVSAPDWHLLAVGARGPIACKEAGYAGLRAAIDRVHSLGGRAYLAHPYWTTNRRHHLPPADYERLLTEGGFDGIELLGEVAWEDNLRSLARWSEPGTARRYPILGNSDTHSAAHTYGGFWTLVWAEARTREAILQAIEEQFSVACGLWMLEPPGHPARQRFQAFGPYELVDLAIFLDHHYFPMHDALCREEAGLARRALAGEALPAGAMEAVAARLEALERECCAPAPVRGRP